ncbi:DNA repair protein RadC [Cytobacillus solani]|uniref:RadC family protein n=1 Tax=Cytobacillus solani TaxID=1637975 RepID=UPI0006ABAC73|nr:DNA repair protein RadC [Cytobacillus solani]KOP81356.1 DNA repair protein RadC [Bacillus sp. FJAT-21945]
MKLEKVVEIVKFKQVVNERAEYHGYQIKSPEDAANILMKEIGSEDREVFMVIVLNTKNKVTAIHRCHVGSINASIVHPREVMKSAIRNNGASIVVGHNHPSYDPTPSKEDIEVTKRLAEAGRILGIELLDHIIVSNKTFISLKEKGYL